VKGLSIIVPLYKSKKHLLLHQSTISRVCEERCEIVFVDDCSPEEEHRWLQSLLDTEDNIKIIRLEKNIGQHKATALGISQARFPQILTVDADMLGGLPNLVSMIHDLDLSTDELVYFIPKRTRSVIRTLLSNMLARTIRLRHPAFQQMASLRLFSKSILDFSNESMPCGILDFALLKTKKIIRFSPCDIDLDTSKTSYSVAKQVGLTFKIFSYVFFCR
tara:strand:- start:1233 stop:1889 length:657 start_codon:yes stop_codon:yes gene_type:complete